MALADFRNSIITQDRFSATFRKFDQGVQTSARGIDKLGAVISGGGAGMLFGAVAGAAGVAAIGKTVWSLGELGAQSLTTKASFENLMSAVGQSPALLDRLSAAAGGTITEMTLMQQANSALAGTTGQLSQEMAAALPRLLEAGRAAAKLNPAYGDAAFMFQSLVSGVKRGTPMLIDNTGITLKIGEATEAYADSIGKSVTELTAQERSIAILRATLEGADVLINQAGTSTKNYTTDIQRAKVAIEELKTAIGEMAAPAVAGTASALAGVLNEVRSVVTSTDYSRAAASLAGYKQQLEELANVPIDRGIFLAGGRAFQSIEDKASAIAETQAAIDRLVKEMYQLEAADLAAAAQGENFKRVTMEYGGAAINAAGETSVLANQIMALASTITGGAAGLRQFASGIQSVFSAAGATGSTRAFLGGVDVFSQQQYVAITQQRIDVERALNVQVAAGILTQEQADYQLATFDRRVNDHIGTLRDATKGTNDYAKAQDDLKSKIGSALTPTFDLSGLTGGVLGGMGGDSFDEAYKRLAAVALRPQEELTKHAGDWASTFEQAGLTGLTPEEAQARAKELVEAYSKGLDFSLIDREAIKDSVRQAIKAEELYQTIVDEIYAEMGKPNPKAATAGHALGKQVGAGVLKAAREAGGVYAAELAMAVSPHVARILSQDAARYNL